MSKNSNLYHITLTFNEPCLGTAPSNPAVYADYIASKKYKLAKEHAETHDDKLKVEELEKELTAEELATLPEEDKGVTVFRRKDGVLVLGDFMIRGYLKESGQAMGLGEGNSTWGLAGKIDRFIFVTDAQKKPTRWLPLMRNGKPITAPDGHFQRPLRAMTLQGPRVTLACSEQVDAGATMDFYVYVLPLGASGKKGKGAITAEVIKEWYSYGEYCGLGQWRSGGCGRFTATVEEV